MRAQASTSVATARRAWPAVLAAAVIALFAAGDGAQAVAAAQNAGPAASGPRPALTVSLVKPQSTMLARRVAANGNIAAWQEAAIGAEIGGLKIADVKVNVGDRVKKGQVLATFVPDMIQADVAQTRASIAEAEAMAANAAVDAQRARELQTTGALSAQQINQYLTAERTAKARLDAVRAASRTAQLRLNYTSVRASDDGVISQRQATVGAVVGPGQELFRLIRGGRVEWRAEVPSAELPRIQVGQTARVTPPGGSVITGRVRVVAPTVDPTTRNGIVYVDLPHPQGALPGMYARGEVDMGESPALTVPSSAVVLRDGFSQLYTVGSDSRVRALKVTAGRRVGDRVEISQGLEAGTAVIATGTGFLNDGDLVRVVAAPAAAPAPVPATVPVSSASPAAVRASAAK